MQCPIRRLAVLHWQDGAAHSTPPPGSGQLRPPRSFSVNKIPGAALLGEVTSKAWGNVAKATSHGVSGLGHQMDKLPGAGSLKSLRVPDLPKMPSLPGVPFPAGAAAAPAGAVVVLAAIDADRRMEDASAPPATLRLAQKLCLAAAFPLLSCFA